MPGHGVGRAAPSVVVAASSGAAAGRVITSVTDRAVVMPGPAALMYRAVVAPALTAVGDLAAVVCVLMSLPDRVGPRSRRRW